MSNVPVFWPDYRPEKANNEDAPSIPLVWGRPMHSCCVTSDLDGTDAAVLYRHLGDHQEASIRLVLILYPACRTTKPVLTELYELTRRFGSRCQCQLLVTDAMPVRTTLCLSSACDGSEAWLFGGNSPGLSGGSAVRGNANFQLRPSEYEQQSYVKWFAGVSLASTTLSEDLTDIPPLVPARGTEEAVQHWAQYQNRVEMARESLTGASEPTSDAKPDSTSTEPDPAAERTVQLCRAMHIAPPNPLSSLFAELAQKGELVTIDKTTRIPPLEVPIKPDWLGVSGFREVGTISRRTQVKIKITDEKTQRDVEKYRKGTATLLAKFTFPLADGLRWIPKAAKPAFLAELERMDADAMKFLGEAFNGEPAGYVKAQRDRVRKDATAIYRDFYPEGNLPEVSFEMIMQELERRYRELGQVSLLPKVSFASVNLETRHKGAHISEWAQNRSLLTAIAEYPRKAIQDRRFFFNGLRTTHEKELLIVMNVMNDPIIDAWGSPEGTEKARLELEYLENLKDEPAGLDVCQKLVTLIRGGLNVADLGIPTQPALPAARA